MNTQTVESTLETALADAKQELANAEAERARLEVRIVHLRTEAAGLEAALARRRETIPEPNTADVSSRQTNTNQGQIVLKDISIPPNSIDPAIAGVATLVMLLIDKHQDWITKKRASAVELVLRSAERPLHRTVITQTLQRVGRPKDTLRDVSAALAYLNRTQKAIPIGDGVWVHIDFSRQYLEQNSN